MRKFSGTQGHLTEKPAVRSSWNLNSLRFYACSSCKQAWRYMYHWKWTSFFFTTQGHITKKWSIRSCCNSNLSEILCLSLLPVSFMKTEFIVIEKKWRHHFLIGIEVKVLSVIVKVTTSRACVSPKIKWIIATAIIRIISGCWQVKIKHICEWIIY